MKKFPIVDLHTDFVLSCYKKGEEFKSKKQINLNLIKKGKIKIFFSGFSYDDIFNDTDKQVNVLLKVIKNKKNNLHLIKSKKDLDYVLNSKTKKGVILHLEGSKIIDEKLILFNKLYEIGLRSLSLTHSEKNQFAAGNKINPKEGLTKLGKKLVKEAIKKSVIVDLAHLNFKSFYDVLKLTVDYQPPVITHTATYKYCSDPRNLKDEQIKEIAKNNGIIGIFFSEKYINHSNKKTNMNDVIKHMIHIIEVGSINTLTIGSDFGGITTGLPKGLNDITKLQILISELKKFGFSDDDILKISCLNAIRVISQILK